MMMVVTVSIVAVSGIVAAGFQGVPPTGHHRFYVWVLDLLAIVVVIVVSFRVAVAVVDDVVVLGRFQRSVALSPPGSVTRSFAIAVVFVVARFASSRSIRGHAHRRIRSHRGRSAGLIVRQ